MRRNVRYIGVQVERVEAGQRIVGTIMYDFDARYVLGRPADLDLAGDLRRWTSDMKFIIRNGTRDAYDLIMLEHGDTIDHLAKKHYVGWAQVAKMLDDTRKLAYGVR